MSKIKRLEIKNYLGISEFSFDFGKVNFLTGRTGEGKTSIIESLEKAFTNKSRRTEVIRHGEDEARIYVQTDDGLEIERKIRSDKGDYLRVRKSGQSVPSTQGFLNKFISGEVFRPLEFVKKSSEDQAKIILNMLDIPWSTNDIQTWFGELPGVNYEAHILQVLKQIESLYYTQREAVNREIKVLEAQVSGIRNELPPNYDGEEWRSKKVSEYYGKVAQAEEVNRKITAAKNLIEGLEERIATLKAEAEADKQSKKNAFDRQRADVREFIQFINQKVEKAETVIAGVGERLAASEKDIGQKFELDVEKANSEYQMKLQELKELHEMKLQSLRNNAEIASREAKAFLDQEVSKAQSDISNCKNSLTAKEQELLNIDTLEEQALASIDENTNQRIETESAKAGNAKEDSEKKLIDIDPLQAVAEKVAHMQSFLREFDRMDDMIKTKIAPKQELSQTLTARIETARTMPMELLKTAAVPIPEIAVDGNGKIRIGGTLLDGLSEGEQLDLALRVAKAQAGELKLICIDGISKINPSNRKWLEDEMLVDEYQYYILDTTDQDLTVKIEGEI
ncbi:MAG: AAA family ATPase [Bacillota bacterium]|nr:AAA family ATPase [Bacillota bacterium]